MRSRYVSEQVHATEAFRFSLDTRRNRRRVTRTACGQKQSHLLQSTTANDDWFSLDFSPVKTGNKSIKTKRISQTTTIFVKSQSTGHTTNISAEKSRTLNLYRHVFYTDVYKIHKAAMAISQEPAGFHLFVRDLVICLTSRNPRGVSSQALQAGIKQQRRHVSKPAEGWGETPPALF